MCNILNSWIVCLIVLILHIQLRSLFQRKKARTKQLKSPPYMIYNHQITCLVVYVNDHCYCFLHPCHTYNHSLSIKDYACTERKEKRSLFTSMLPFIVHTNARRLLEGSNFVIKTYTNKRVCLHISILVCALYSDSIRSTLLFIQFPIFQL
jgi:hypothetical protein